ncbi:MAG TPA: spermidine/putrescine ABC transporter substrate-binding protein [Solirubrobacteraceae bacterium]|nr:spermidine/putrescine ABC transporter substrate-binding protein [Solirubrobacteraceae bacterium]
MNTDRRTFIRRATAAAASLSVPGVLAACGNTTAPVAGNSSSSHGPNPADIGPGGLPLARANHPVTLPIYAGNQAIANGLTPEKGPLELYNWIAYINPQVITDFEKKYKVKVHLSTFVTIEEAIAKLTSKAVQYDVFWPTAGYIEELVAGKLVQPINHSYLPNLAANVWPSLQNPWYDQGSRYTVPYTIYTVGIGWRADKLPNFNPASLANPWNALWQVGPTIKGRVGVLDDERDCMAMALLRNGITDINTSSAQKLAVAKNSMVQLVNSTNLKFDTNEYQHLADGSLWLHEAWSGDMAAAPSYLPKGVKPSVLRYWYPGTGKGPINNDMLAVLNGAKNPVLAHLFLNHILDTKEVFTNFSYNFYQQPINAMTPDVLVKQGLIPPTLQSTLIQRSQFDNGYVEGPLSQNAQVLWENTWAAIKSA